MNEMCSWALDSRLGILAGQVAPVRFHAQQTRPRWHRSLPPPLNLCCTAAGHHDNTSREALAPWRPNRHASLAPSIRCVYHFDESPTGNVII